jgi:hypothetical protein
MDNQITQAIAAGDLEFLKGVTDHEWLQSGPTLNSWFTKICESGHLNIVKWAYDKFEVRHDCYVVFMLRAACLRGHLHIAQWLRRESGLSLNRASMNYLIIVTSSPDVELQPHIAQWMAVGAGTIPIAWSVRQHAKLYPGWCAGAVIMAGAVTLDILHDVLTKLADGSCSGWVSGVSYRCLLGGTVRFTCS